MNFPKLQTSSWRNDAITPGVYALIASGTGGVAAVGFKAVGTNSTISKAKAPKNVKLVSFDASVAAQTLNVGLAPPSSPGKRADAVRDGTVVERVPAPLIAINERLSQSILPLPID